MVIFQICTMLILLISCSSELNSGQVTIQKKIVENYKICLIGDSGKNNRGQKYVAQALTNEGCNQVRHLGDIIYAAGIEDKEDQKYITHFYQYYKQLIDSGVPFYMSLGNHDYKKNPEAWIQIAKSVENIYFPGLYFMDIFSDICFTTLDTNSNFLSQIYWFKTLNQKYSKICKLNLAFGHHPLYSSGEHGNAALGVKVFLNMTINGTVDAYFSGHEHHLEDVGKKDGTQYFISGSAASTRKLKKKPTRWGISKLGYQTLTVHYKNKSPYVKYSFYSIDAESGEKNLEHSGSIHSGKNDI